jgi:hypothetical protein
MRAADDALLFSECPAKERQDLRRAGGGMYFFGKIPVQSFEAQNTRDSS